MSEWSSKHGDHVLMTKSDGIPLAAPRDHF